MTSNYSLKTSDFLLGSAGLDLRIGEGYLLGDFVSFLPYTISTYSSHLWLTYCLLSRSSICLFSSWFLANARLNNHSFNLLASFLYSSISITMMLQKKNRLVVPHKERPTVSLVSGSATKSVRQRIW
jgi:hypothetical protein